MPTPTRSWKRRLLWTLALVALLLLTKFILHLLLPRNVAASGEMLSLDLAGGALAVPCFTNGDVPVGIVILGTGDGGWSYWEENTARHLMDQGYAVGGWDCRKFADSRSYRQADLAAGFRAAVEAVRKRTRAASDTPVWFGGWSTGAEQSVAAAASPDRPRYLVGLLLAAPGARGRYGLTTSDLLGVTPQGPDTFALADLAPRITGIRVAQFAAGLDPMDDVRWLDALTAPHRIFHLPGKPHDMGGAGPEFQSTLDEALAWTLEPPP